MMMKSVVPFQLVMLNITSELLANYESHPNINEEYG